MVGDGGLLMRAGELELAGRMRLPVIVVVFNDSGLGTIRSRQAARGFPQKAVDLGPVDIAKMAQACGCLGARVETAADYERACLRAEEPRAGRHRRKDGTGTLQYGCSAGAGISPA